MLLCEMLSSSLLTLQNGKFYTASDDNAVSAFTFKDGQSDGIVARFTAPATHFCFNSSGSTIVAGARCVNVIKITVKFIDYHQ